MELMIATILIGIVMVTVGSFTVAIKQVQQTTIRSTFLSMQVTAAMNHITRNASLAIGHAADPGIRLDNSATPPYLSFRQDRNADFGTTPTPDDYTDDRWEIYFYQSPNLMYCEQTDAEGSTPNTSSGNCASALVLSNKIKSATFNLVNNPAQYQFYVEVVLVGCDDVTTCNPTTNSDPLNNPIVRLQTRISPTAQSW